MEQVSRYIYRDIFRAIHEGKWLCIEYLNQNQEVTKYWIGILDLDPQKGTLKVDGLHLGRYTTGTYDPIYISAIQSSRIIEGTYCPVNERLTRDIYLNPEKYKHLFDNTTNLKILNYLEMCSRMDTVPYYSDFELVHFLDRDSFFGEAYELSEKQFRSIVKNFQYKAEEKENARLRLQQLAMNVLSIHTARGLYVLAYRKLQLDVKSRLLRADEEIVICTEFTLDGRTESIRKFLDAEEYELLKDFARNQETIKNCITNHNRQVLGVDDMPYVIGLGMDVILDLHKEYEAILKMYREGKETEPVRAFFGDLLARPVRRKDYPIILINRRVNLDQLLAINNAMKYPVAYIQGPPGTGKTNTIINTIVTAFFNEKTVLFASYNNHPINGVVEKLTGLKFRDKTIPFPILRLGNAEKVKEALLYIRELYDQTRNITVYESTLEKNKGRRTEDARQLSQLLRKYEELLDLKERSETLNRVLDYELRYRSSQPAMQMLPFQTDLKGRQLQQVNHKIRESGTVSEEEALALLEDDEEELKKYLYYTSARFLKRLDEPKNKDLKDIILAQNDDAQAADFAKYLREKGNIKKLQKIFPVIATTCISAHKLGAPEPMFDMVIMDEASQCNNAVALVPIIRGDNLMLVGDPQQLNPVIVLDELANRQLKKRYHVPDEYDYVKNSVYKTYLACDAVSDEVLLHYHYRCDKKIIEFNNRKYYRSRLLVKSESRSERPLFYIDVQNSFADSKNTAPAEVEEILNYAALHQDKSIGVITPFVNQKNLIEEGIRQRELKHVTCGTVHAFQGDEKDVILFSTAITDNTHQGSYDWLKNNKELINVATSRAREQLIVLSNSANLERLHRTDADDDLYELVTYVKKNGDSKVTPKKSYSRALGVKPFSTATEEAFLQNLSHALENIWLSQSRFTVHKEVAVAHVFQENTTYDNLFYCGRFDFVVYERMGEREIPVLAIELDGKEHFEDEVVRQRDLRKNAICQEHNLQLIRVENSYARRYNHIKEILMNYFAIRH